MSAPTASETDLLSSETEEDLRAAVRALLNDRSPVGELAGRVEAGPVPDPALWRALGAEMGLAGLLVEASAREVAVVLEELGAAVAPVPFLESAVLAAAALAGCGSDAARETLDRLASGAVTGALAVSFAASPWAEPPWEGVRADAAGALTGRVTSVPGLGAADVLLVPAHGPDGPGLWEVRADDPGVRVAPVVSLDLTRPVGDLQLDGARGRLLAGPEPARVAVRQALLTGAGLLASEQLGVARWCLESTVAYVKERRQFGRPVGSFQAVKHRLADVWLEVVSARAAARGAADALAQRAPDAPLLVAVAQAYCSRAAVRAAEEAVQLHGGIGMTWEHPAHLFLKRAKSAEIALGTPGRHRGALAELADLPGPVR
jgi:alkylation response protein AidB-like acyl-CoA dehydrogenase